MMTTEAHVHTSTNLALFREKVVAARRQTGRLQRELADALGINAQVLSRKLHGVRQVFLTHAEVKQIIKTLAAWDAISKQAEAVELLSLMGLRAESFTAKEWNSSPLNQLEPVSRSTTAGIASLTFVQSINSALPVPSTSLIGREAHVGILLDRLRQSSVRLLTLVGTGGVGKTRLALEVAHAARHNFADGVFFVYMAAIRDAGLVPSTILQALHLSEPLARDDPNRQSVSSQEDVLKGFLREKELLLVLDNVEQIPDIASCISDLLSTVPGLKIMVTSRAILHVYGEHEFEVPPLGVCPLDHEADQNYIAHFPAIRLFVERAQAINAAFQITKYNAETIASICARLDGIPLAIELAAARTKLLPLPKILERLVNGTGQSLTFLRSTTHNVLQRHRSLEAMLDWSYELLDPQQQRLFRRLSVFLGSWTLEVALEVAEIGPGIHKGPTQPHNHPVPLHVVTSGSYEIPTMDDMLEQMEALIDQSLVRRMPLDEGSMEESQEPRFYFLEMIREYVSKRTGENMPLR
jgi:predicted ATPase